MRHTFEVGIFLALVFLFSPIAAGQNNRSRTAPKPTDVLSEKQIALELSKLRQMSTANKAKVRRALDALREAFLTASVSTDMEEVAEGGNKAIAAVDAAEEVRPNGALKGHDDFLQKGFGAFIFSPPGTFWRTGYK